MISNQCQRCGKKYTVDDSHMGRRMPCNQCGGLIIVQAPPEPEPELALDDGPPPLPAVSAEESEWASLSSAASASLSAADPSPGGSFRRRPPKKSSSAGIWIGGILVVLLLGGLGWSIARRFTPAGPGKIIVKAPVPQLPAFRNLGNDVEQARVTLNGDGPGQRTTFWIYRPKPATTRTHGVRSLPCVLIAPAGSTMVTGMKLSADDQGEHLPWAEAGFVVIAYDLDGQVPGGDTTKAGEMALRKVIREFIAAEGGVANGRAALDQGLAMLPEVDPARVYVAGHSSAGTVALAVANDQPSRVKAAAVFAPGIDISKNFTEHIRDMEQAVPGLTKFVDNGSPGNLPGPKCPVFLFQADDDTVVAPAAARVYAGSRKNVTLKSVPSGGHSSAVVNVGVPAAIAWMKTVDGKMAPAPAKPAKPKPKPEDTETPEE